MLNTIHGLHAKLINKEISATEITQSVLDRIDAVEAEVGCYITQTRESALAQARAVDAKLAAGEQISPLAGIPGALKDNICTNGVKTTCASKILADFVPPYNAEVVDRLAAEDAVFLGKLNMDEFAMGGSTENSAFKRTANPWELGSVPGGSSGGSAAAIAAGEAVWTLGSDTGGSIRQPSAYCGTVGLKPTYGLVSRYGVVAYASSLDQVGPITRDVTDAALVLNAIAGFDAKDATSIRGTRPDYTSALVNNIKGLKIGIPQEYFAEGIDARMAKTVREAISTLEKLGAEIIEVTMPHTEYALAAYYIIGPAEVSSNMARYDGVSYGLRADGEDIVSMYKNTRSTALGKEVQRRIMLGTYVLSSGYYDAYYNKALKVRTLVKHDFEQAFEKVDILATPTTPAQAFKFGAKSADPMAMYMDVCTVPVNLAGVPAISLPCGFIDNMPVGLQLIGKALGEADLLRAAYTFEQNTEYHKRIAPLGGR